MMVVVSQIDYPSDIELMNGLVCHTKGSNFTVPMLFVAIESHEHRGRLNWTSEFLLFIID